eukprot:CAMPEP_0202699096 /NCGR_PEP_ID=MMETSP1385-20130828/12319_1 /ASSEMBLY_ACC=CAM_ASM_000861 /TAXON_ID=933848 /ORGANISM="Elphidium margaritaceum" /LENGTH=454 /DNA_ID=CAMNT_0049355957 /DNA_START=27 /DNA_END=1391 /DNA_ORIENTATION=-
MTHLLFSVVPFMLSVWTNEAAISNVISADNIYGWRIYDKEFVGTHVCVDDTDCLIQVSPTTSYIGPFADDFIVILSRMIECSGTSTVSISYDVLTCYESLDGATVSANDKDDTRLTVQTPHGEIKGDFLTFSNDAAQCTVVEDAEIAAAVPECSSWCRWSYSADALYETAGACDADIQIKIRLVNDGADIVKRALVTNIDAQCVASDASLICDTAADETSGPAYTAPPEFCISAFPPRKLNRYNGHYTMMSDAYGEYEHQSDANGNEYAVFQKSDGRFTAFLYLADIGTANERWVIGDALYDDEQIVAQCPITGVNVDSDKWLQIPLICTELVLTSTGRVIAQMSEEQLESGAYLMPFGTCDANVVIETADDPGISASWATMMDSIHSFGVQMPDSRPTRLQTAQIIASVAVLCVSCVMLAMFLCGCCRFKKQRSIYKQVDVAEQDDDIVGIDC